MLERALYALGIAVIRLLGSTYRYRLDGQPGPPHLPEPQDRYLYAIWHQNLFSGILAQTGRRHVVIVSRSRDGDFVSALCARLGHTACRGSSRKGDRDKGGKQAKGSMVETLRTGLPGAITVDGPSGPPRQVKPGIVDMARQSGHVIVPYATIPRSCWVFSSWDRFRLPKPFSVIDVRYGEPIAVPADTAFEQFGAIQERIAAAINALDDSELPQ